MREKLSHLAVPVLLLALFVASPAFSVSYYYVSTTGLDSNPGTIGSPFATITKARDVIRTLDPLPAGGVVVYIRGGNYLLTSQIDFTIDDSGTATEPIVYCAYPGETPKFVGGLKLDPSWFTLVPSGDAIFTTRLPSSANGYVYQCDLSAHSITNYGILRVRGMSFGHVLAYQTGEVSHMELSFDGTMMNLAGWPNTGYSTITTGSSSPGLTFTYTTNPTNESKWPNATDPWVDGYWNYDFYNQYLPVATVNTSTNTVTLDQAPGNPSITAGKRWRAVNLLEELDQAGEYYIERTVGNTYYGKLYFWPPSTLSGKEIFVSTLGENSESLLKCTGAAYITFRGLTFEVGRFNAVGMDTCSYVALDQCTVRNVGNMGVRIENSTNCGVQSSNVYGVGFGIILSGGNRTTLAAGNNYARNNDIHNFGRWCRTYQSGIALYGVGNEASNNNIYYGPDHGILVFNNNHLVQYNKIHHVVQEADDSAGIYSYWGWDTRGSVIKFNTIYDITESISGTGVWGIYIDGYTSGTTMFGNIIHNISGYGGLFYNGGRDNAIDNCVITSTNRVITSTEAAYTPTNRAVEQLNLVRPFNYQSAPWSTAYPTLAALPNNDTTILPYAHPGGCSITRNIEKNNSVWLYPIPGMGDPFNASYCTQTNNLTNTDPYYVDEANRYLALKENSPAYNIPGFTRIPFEKIGKLDLLKASNPNPPNNYTGASVTLTYPRWGEAYGCTYHTVYLGTSYAAVDAATTASPECVSPAQNYTVYVPTLTAGVTYYWRIDETQNGVTTKGDVWNFTTAANPPTFVAAGPIGAGVSAIGPSLPSGIAVNDILLFFIETSNQAVSIANGGGGTWTQVTNSPQYCGTAAGTTGARLTVFWSRYNGTQTSPTTSDSGDHQQGRIIAIRGATTSGNPWDVTAGSTEATSDTSGSITGVTTTVANTLVITAIASALPDATSTTNFSSWTNANLTSLAEYVDNANTPGNGGGIGVAGGVKASTGATGNTAVTLGSSSYKAMMTIAIKP
jgi:hypothetical protein